MTICEVETLYKRKHQKLGMSAKSIPHVITFIIWRLNGGNLPYILRKVDYYPHFPGGLSEAEEINWFA